MTDTTTHARAARRATTALLLTLALALATGAGADIAPDPPRPEPAPEPAPAPAPAADEALPAAAELFARNVTAIGGEDAIRAHSSAIMTARMSIPAQGIQAEMKLYVRAPDFYYAETELPGIGTMLQGHTDGVGWSSDPMSGPELLEGAALIEQRRTADFYADLNYATLYTTMETVERVRYGSYDAYKVRAVSPEGAESLIYFDTATGLRVGSESTVETQIGPMPVQVICDEFHEYDGVLTAVKCSESTGPIQAMTRVESVLFDPPDFPELPLPAGVAELLKERTLAP